MERGEHIVDEAFGALTRLRRADQLPPPSEVREYVERLITGLRRQLAKAGVSRKDEEDSAYAVVALADEMFLERSEAFQAYWLENLLQVQFFGQNVAGDEFFTRLEAARNEARWSVVRAYYTALLLGFQGRYRVERGERELEKLVREVGSDLSLDGNVEKVELAPAGEPPPERLEKVRQFGSLRIAFLAGGIFCLAMVWWVALGGHSYYRGQELARTAVESLGPPAR